MKVLVGLWPWLQVRVETFSGFEAEGGTGLTYGTSITEFLWICNKDRDRESSPEVAAAWMRGGSKGGEAESDAGFTLKVEQTQLTDWIEGGGEGGQDCKVPVWNKPLCVELGKAACEACLTRGVCDLLSPREPPAVCLPRGQAHNANVELRGEAWS